MDFGLCQKIATYIMRPPRTTYAIEDLGPKSFHHRSRVYERLDFQVQNQRKLKIQCSLFKQKYKVTERETVVFLHANSSSRLAVKNYLTELLPFFNVACMDCSGSGISQGNFVTLGFYEKEDLRALISFLKTQFNLDKFILWGRSMGAVTSLLYAAKYQDVEAVVSDNAFSDLEETCKQLKDNYLSIFPDFLLETLLQSTQEYMDENMNKTQKLNFKLKELKPKLSVTKMIKLLITDTAKYFMNVRTTPKGQCPSKGMYYIILRDHNGARDADIKVKVIDYLLEIMAKNKKSKESMIKHKQSDLLKKQEEEEEIVYESPFNEDLRQSYLGSSKKKRTATQSYEEQSLQKKFSFKLERKQKNYPASQTFISYPTSQTGSGVFDSELKQDQYKIETTQFTRSKTSCFDSCQPTRRRKKIFTNS